MRALDRRSKFARNVESVGSQWLTSCDGEPAYRIVHVIESLGLGGAAGPVHDRARPSLYQQ